MNETIPILPNPVTLPSTREAVLRVLARVASPEQYPHSHKKIAEWCDRFWCSYLDVDAPDDIDPLLPILTSVETQWDLYLANTYSISELRSHSFDLAPFSRWTLRDKPCRAGQLYVMHSL